MSGKEYVGMLSSHVQYCDIIDNGTLSINLDETTLLRGYLELYVCDTINFNMGKEDKDDFICTSPDDHRIDNDCQPSTTFADPIFN